MACFDEDTWAQGVDWCAAPVQLPDPCLWNCTVPVRQVDAVCSEYSHCSM